MKGYVAGIDWINAEAMKYWSFPSSYKGDKKSDTRNMIFSGDYIGAIKVDGYYERLIKDEDGNCFMVARSKNVSGEAVEKLAWVPHIIPFMESLPNGTVLLSECYLPGDEGSKKITSLLGCLKEKCIARQAAGQKLHFYIFDVMAWGNEDLTRRPFDNRILYIEDNLPMFANDFIEGARYYEGEELWNKLQAALADGREGMVIMQKKAPVYFKRTPARVSLKIKKELRETIDCFFTGRAAAPKRYYFHWAGSLEIGLINDSGAIVGIGYLSGITDELKEHYKDYTKRVIEIGAMELNDTGGLRHAKMLGWRDDKTWEECSISQLKDL